MWKVWTKSLESSSKYECEFVYEYLLYMNASDIKHLIEKEFCFSFFVILVLFTFKEKRETILMDHGFF